jgi:hypothetical protein
MNHASFWDFFEAEAAPHLSRRAETFRQIFEYLDLFDRPVIIVETGCVRNLDGMELEGLSTYLFDKYINHRDADSVCISVDLNADAIQTCQSLVSPRTSLHKFDSVEFLARLVEVFQSEDKWIDMLYLDSMDIDFQYWQASAAHHLKELAIGMQRLHQDSLVVVDDSPSSTLILNEPNGGFSMVVDHTRVGGKGTHIAEVAAALGAKPLFMSYQVGWTRFVRNAAHT